MNFWNPQQATFSSPVPNIALSLNWQFVTKGNNLVKVMTSLDRILLFVWLVRLFKHIVYASPLVEVPLTQNVLGNFWDYRQFVWNFSEFLMRIQGNSCPWIFETPSMPLCPQLCQILSLHWISSLSPKEIIWLRLWLVQTGSYSIVYNWPSYTACNNTLRGVYQSRISVEFTCFENLLSFFRFKEELLNIYVPFTLSS